jgi:hypothetical protein
MMTTQNHRPTATPAVLDATHGSTFRTVKALVATYFGVSVATVAAVALLAGDATMVNSTVWTRTVIVLFSSALMFLMASRAAKGARRSFLRLRLTSGIMTIAIVVLISLPGLLPLWIKLEQGFCGLLLLGVVALVNGTSLRAAFATK